MSGRCSADAHFHRQSLAMALTVPKERRVAIWVKRSLTKHEASTPCTQRRTRKRAHRNVSSQNNPETSANQWWGMQRSWHSLWVYTLQHATRRRARAETAMMQNRAKQHMIPRWVEHHSCTSSRGDECVAVSAETTTHRCGCLQRLATERLMHRLRCSLPS